MRILAYDSSGARLSVALFQDKKKLAETTSEPGARHSSVLLPMIERLLKKNQLTMGDIDVLAVGLGPGSFTGLRVGVATAKILGYVLKKKIVGVSGLEAMATSVIARGEARVAAMMDARKGQVYGAIYEKKGDRTKTELAPALMTRERFMEKARGAVLVAAEQVPPTASDVARAALPWAVSKRFIDPFDLEPLYLHARDCNVTYPKKK